MNRQFYEPGVETMARAELEKLQLAKLRTQVSRCYAESPFYRERLDRNGVQPGQIRRLDDLRRLPFLHKNELREEQERYPFFGRLTMVPQSEWVVTHPTTGTTGRPVHCVWSRRDLTEYVTEVIARNLWVMGARPGAIVHNGFSYGLFVAGLTVHQAAQRLGCLVVPVGAAPTERQLDYLLNLKSTVLLATPSFALYLAERLRSAGHKPEELSLRVGCFGGEPGTEVPATRGILEVGLGLSAHDFYGLAEICPGNAAECAEKDGLHYCEDHNVIEVIDPDSLEPVPEGESGVLVLTDLSREAAPLLRYWTDDIVRVITAPCRCGRTHARSPGGVIGRADDRVNFKGAKFYPTQAESVVRSFAEFTPEFRIVLRHDEGKGADVCALEVEAARELEGESDGLERLKRQLGAKLREVTQCTFEISVVPGGSLERTTHKAKRVVDLRARYAG